jgi:hypothetical protein
VNVSETPDGHLLTTPAYRVLVRRDRPLAVVESPAGERVARLVLLAAIDTTDGLDGAPDLPVVRLGRTSADETTFVVETPSTRWRSKRVILRCLPDALEISAEVEGEGDLADVRLLGGRHPGDRAWGSGFQRSRIDAATLVSPNPEDPRRIAVSTNEPTTIGVVGGGGIGRGHWFFTPAPLCLVFSAERTADPAVPPAGPWTSVGLAAPVEELTFSAMLYEPLDAAFALRLDYEGQTRVGGSWRSPAVVVRVGASDAYEAIARDAAGLAERGLAPPRSPAPTAADAPVWWFEPIFCGWGAQGAIAAFDDSQPADHATQATYDRFLQELHAHGIDPGTIVIDDRWERRYGSGEPDRERWPDLAAWIERRHAEGRRVLVWWKAWDPEAVSASMCVTTATARPVAVDPSNPAYRSFLADRIAALLAPPPDGLGADGLKIDFTARTPSGAGLLRHGPEWGIALLHRLLATIHDAAKAARPDALVVAHAPNAAFADVADAVRLNDVLRLDDADWDVPVVAQMRHRAAVARAAVPGLLVETDDWGMPSHAAWREFLGAKAALGIPSLYYTTRLDLTGEALSDDDAAAVRAVWTAWRDEHGLAPRPALSGAAR